MLKYLTNKKIYVYIYIYIYTLIVFLFYDYVGFNNQITKIFLFITIMLMMVLSFKTIILKKQNLLFRIMRLILISTFCSMFSSWIFREQSLMLGYRVTAPLLIILLFFYLYKKKPSLKFIELYIFFFGVLYIILWSIGFSQLPDKIFGISESEHIDMSRGMERINFTGRISLILAYFLCIVKYSVTKKTYFIGGAIIFFIFIVLQLTRQLIFWTALVTIYYVYKRSKLTFYIGAILLISFLGATKNVQFSNDSALVSMYNLTQEQAEVRKSTRDEDIRLVAYKYFMGDFSNNTIANIIGNGMPHSDSLYGKLYTNNQYKGLNLSDVGYAKIYVINGLLGIFLYISLFLVSLKSKIPNDLSYAKLFILFLIPANIMADWYSKPDGQIALSICVYLIAMYNIKKNKNEIQYNNTSI